MSQITFYISTVNQLIFRDFIYKHHFAATNFHALVSRVRDASKGPCRVLEKCAFFKVRAGFRLGPWIKM